jgi:hypothetical protein
MDLGSWKVEVEGLEHANNLPLMKTSRERRERRRYSREGVGATGFDHIHYTQELQNETGNRVKRGWRVRLFDGKSDRVERLLVMGIEVWEALMWVSLCHLEGLRIGE